MPSTKPKVLCVDGDPVIRVLVSYQLESRYDVILAEGAEQAGAALGQQRPDLILLDVGTPDGSGYRFFQSLQQHADLSRIPVVFLTGSIQNGVRQKALEVGAADCLEKPVEENLLLDVIARHTATPSDADSESGLSPAEQFAGAKLRLLNFAQFKRFLVEQLDVPSDKANLLADMTPSHLHDIPVKLNIKRAMLAEAIAKYLGVNFVAQVDPDDVLLGILPTKYCEIHDVLPVSDISSGCLFVLGNPFDLEVMDVLFRSIGKDQVLRFAVAEPDVIRRILNTPLFDEEEEPVISEALPDEVPEESPDLLRSSAEDAPIVRLANKVIADAISLGASDIHLEPRKHDVRLRYRIDGMLHEHPPLPGPARAGLVSRFKIISGLDISERRVPQDGRTQVMFDSRRVDIRVSTLPSRHGETVVCRILDQAAVPMAMTDLGFDDKSLAMLRRGIEVPHGIVLVTGPTGSGKTTTLYSVLRTVCTPTVSVVTVEDPVEYELDEVKQVQVRPEAGLTFPGALRSILRQDPDVVMIGEMRDKETVDVALKAAMTGHLVISTLHTNDAPSTVSRLVGMGIEPYLLAGALEMVAAQRLLRRLCKECKQPVTLTPEIVERLKLQAHAATQFYGPKGCNACNNLGYKGRVAVIEILLMDEELRTLVSSNGTADELRRMALERGLMVTLQDSALNKALEGVTSLEEVLRVAGSA